MMYREFIDMSGKEECYISYSEYTEDMQWKDIVIRTGASYQMEIRK